MVALSSGGRQRNARLLAGLACVWSEGRDGLVRLKKRELGVDLGFAHGNARDAQLSFGFLLPPSTADALPAGSSLAQFCFGTQFHAGPPCRNLTDGSISEAPTQCMCIIP